MILGSAQAEPFVQKEFAIGLWVSPPAGEGAEADRVLEARYRECAEANFNLVIGGWSVPAEKQIEVCQRVGLKAIVESKAKPEELPDGPACWGYLLADEPGAAAFADLAKRADEVRAKRPGRLPYVNLFPNYAPEWALGGTYDHHVEQWMKVFKPEVLSMDHYPLMRPDGDSRASYCANLETMRKYSVAAGVPFWNFFHCMPFNDRLDPTEAQIRWQINTSLAYGAKGVLYFCYWTPGKGAGGAGEFPRGGAILTAEGRRTRHYDEAKRINAELKKIGPFLMQLTSVDVYRLKSTDKGPTTRPGALVKSMARVGGDPENEFIVGSLKHADGRRVAIVVNHNHSYTGWATVAFDVPSTDVKELSRETGELVDLVDDSPELKGVQLSFGAGDARVFVLPAKP